LRLFKKLSYRFAVYYIMKHASLFFGLLLILFSIDLSAQSIDSHNSIVNFELDNFSFNTVEGSFKQMTGTLNINPTNLAQSTINACIGAATVNTDNAKRDEHLRREDFFAVQKFPQICFQSQRFSQTSTGYLVKGQLTLRGITKEVSIPFNLENGVFKGQLSINRLDFNIGADYGTFTIGNEVRLSISCFVE
jgi:polyisoprenoid-binding protein YceI